MPELVLTRDEVRILERARQILWDLDQDDGRVLNLSTKASGAITDVLKAYSPEVRR